MLTGLIKKRPWTAGVAAFLLFLLVLLALLWAFRASLAVSLTQRWCKSQNLTCELQVERLGLDGAILKGIRLSGENGTTPVEADRVEAKLSWDGLFSPRLISIQVDKPIVRMEYTSDGKVTLGGLETLASPQGSQNDAPMPKFTVREARIEAMTPAGPVIMTGNVFGNLPFEAEIHAAIEPAKLKTDEGSLNIEEGRVDLELAGVKLTGSAELKLSEARFQTFEARNILLDAQMADSLLPKVEWQAQADRFAGPDLAMSGIQAKGSTGIVTGDVEAEAGPLARIRSFSADAGFALLEANDVQLGPTSVRIDSKRKGKGPLTGSFALEASEVSSPWLNAAQATFSGEGHLGDDIKVADVKGDLRVSGANVPASMRASLLGSIKTGPPFGAHADALKAGLSATMDNFEAGTGYDYRRTADEDWSLVTTRPVSLTARNGALISITADETRPALNVSQEGTLIGGLLMMKGPQLPALTADIKSLEISNGGTSFSAGGTTVRPWQAEGLTLSASLSEIEYADTSGTPRLQTVGEVALQGILFGQTFETTKIFGGIDASLGDSLRVQSFSTRCIGIDSGGFTSGKALSVGAFALQLCPSDGRLVQEKNGTLAGRLSASDVRLPFQSSETTGTLELDQATLDWRAASTASLSVSGSQMSADLTIGDNTLALTAAKPELGFRTTSPLSLSARTGRAEFDGSLIPADASLGSLRFEATLPASGLSGMAEAKDVVIRDPQDDPLYEPLTGELAAAFSNGLMQLSGPVKTVRGGRKVADVNMTLNLVDLDGEASIDTPDLVFEPRGFQPTALSERVRGFLSNARGQLNAGARFAFDGGDVSGTGYVEVSEFGFDTLRVGAVNDVSGRIDFDDLMQLHSAPGQVVRVGAINPGIPLNNGEIRFQLLGPSSAIIERAAWPFAGGELEVGRSEWTIAGARDVVEIAARKLELTQIIGVFNLPDVQANGTVSGRFPVEFVGPNVYIRDATLRADEQGGTLAYTGDIGDAASQADERVGLAFRALKDFQFSVLELGANGNLTGSMKITLNLIGKSPDVLGGAPFAFNIGVDSELMKLIRTGQSMTGTDWLAEVSRTSSEEAPASEADDNPEP